MDETEVREVVRGLLAEHQTMFLSTSGEDGPWGAGTFFVEGDPFTLELVLELHGRTLRNIRQNPKVAVVVSTGQPFEPFLQGAADAEVLDREEELAAIKGRLLVKAPSIEPFFGAPIAAVRLHLRMWRATDVVKGWLPGKELVAPAQLLA
jgi:hypothetical protein